MVIKDLDGQTSSYSNPRDNLIKVYYDTVGDKTLVLDGVAYDSYLSIVSDITLPVITGPLKVCLNSQNTTIFSTNYNLGSQYEWKVYKNQDIK